MKIFEYPYVIITLLFFGFLVLGAIGIYFALKGVKVAKGTREIDFSSVNKLKNAFEKMAKLRDNYCVIYISVPLDNVRSIYSDSKAWRVFSEIKPVLLRNFCAEEDNIIALYDQNNFIALNRWTEESAKTNISQCLNETGRCLLKHKVVNAIDIKFGFYCASSTEVTFDEAINRAKQACVMAENENVSFLEWNANSGRALEKKISIENNIENEIDNNRFFLEYQPIIDGKTKRIMGAEVLSRLNSENDGVLTPGSFLPALDSVGLNGKFDYYIFEKNCKWISNDKLQREKYFYTINFSRTTLCEPLFAEKIIQIANKYNISYSSLAIEVLEDKAITKEDRVQMASNLSKLKEKGVKILLDDFGSGYTTFCDLQNISFNVVKIDKAITHNSDTESGFLILKNIVNTAKDLGFLTLCEGIETKEHEEAALAVGCNMLQGYFYYQPMQVLRLEQLLCKNNTTE